MDAFPFDWRLHPTEPEQSALWSSLQSKIEGLVTRTGRPVVLVTHSMGCPFMQYFLTTQVSAAWKAQNVATWIAVAGPFGGAAVGVK